MTMINYHIWAQWMIHNWGSKQVRRVSDGMLVGLVTSKSRNHAEVTRVFFRWMIQVKVLRPTFELGILPAAPRSDERRIDYLSPAHARAYLAALRPEYRAGFVLQLFAGLRPYEAARIMWQDISFDERRVKVRAEVSKIRRARMIEGVPGALWQYLRPLKPRQIVGHVMPGDDEHIAVGRALRERQRAARIAEVPLGHDIMRHTFATYFAAWKGDAAMCSRILGHYRLSTLAAHYDGVATRREAKDFFTYHRLPG
jgi:integrase